MNIHINIVKQENIDENITLLAASCPSLSMLSAMVYDDTATGAANIAKRVTNSTSLNPDNQFSNHGNYEISSAPFDAGKVKGNT